MQLSGIPTKYTIPWAYSAGGTYINTIPTASQIGINNGYASFTDGFVPLNATPLASGGVPPRVQDWNGILYDITGWQRWNQAGGPITYDSTFQSAVGGYPNGAIVQSAVTGGLYWRSTADNNTTNPDSGGAGWLNNSTGRLINIQTFLASGTYTATAGATRIFVVVQAPGGGSGGIPATGVGQSGGTAPGGGGSAACASYTSASYTFSPVAVTVGTAGTAGTTSGAGGAGGTTSFGSFISCPGGQGSPLGVVSSGAIMQAGAQATSAPSGTALLYYSIGGASPSFVQATAGVFSTFVTTPGAFLGYTYGAGAPTSALLQSSAASAGISGGPGIVIVYEYS